MGLAGLVDLMCHYHGIITDGWAPASIKKHFCGNGRAQKADVEAACRSRGWCFPDNNAADALAVLDMAAHMLMVPQQMITKPTAQKQKGGAMKKAAAPRKEMIAA